MTIRIVDSFLEGDLIPSWLLDLESAQPNQGKCELYFAHDCHIIETSGGFHIIFDGPPPDCPLINAVGTGGSFRMVAPSRSVFTPTSFQVNIGADDEIEAIGLP